MQKLLIIGRDSKEDLIEDIHRELRDAQFVIKGLSVLKELSGYEVWIIIDDQTEELAGFE